MNIRKKAPQWTRVAGRAASQRFGELTASRRPLPDFLVIGGQRCGTTSMFRALMDHPDVRRPNLHKGVNYFDLAYDKGERWYRAHFPVDGAAEQRRVFDSSGYYMFHPMAPERIVRDLPDVKVIAMLRDPVERAFSAYKHELARGFEWEKTFADALALEDARLEGETERMREDPSYQSFNHRHHAYRRRGEYATLLEPFVEGLGRDNVLVVESERFFETPETEYQRIVDFLDLAPHVPSSFERYNARPGTGMGDGVREKLSEHFEEHDERLGELIGQAPVWRTR